MPERSDKHSPLTDDQMHREVEDIEQKGVTSHAEEFYEPEPSGEDQVEVDRVPEGEAASGTPPGMSEVDVELRAELARYANPESYPATRDELLDAMRSRHAPDRLVAMVQKLDRDRSVDNAQELAEAVGIATEQRRF